MRIQWMPAIALGAILAVGCGGGQTNQTDQPKAAPPVAATPDQNQANREAVSPNPETPAPAQAEQARPTTGTTPRARAPREARKRVAEGAPAATAAPRITAPAETGAPAAVAPREEFREVTVPAGTVLPLELLTPLASDTAQIETPVRARVRESISVNGFTAIPAGSTLIGVVTEVAESGRVSGKARLAFRFTEIEANGARDRIRTNPLTYEAEATKGEDATKIGAGAGIGAVIGGLLGGGKGAAQGAAIGGAAGTGVVLATKGKEVSLPAGTDVAATLSEPLTLQVPVR